jgi:hypothetical protein
MDEHVLEDGLWSVIRKRQPLGERYRKHIRDCRDCREFVQEVACVAEGQGFTFDEGFQMALSQL